MKKFDTHTYLYIAAAGIVLILALVVIYMLTPVSKADVTQYVYIDDDDTAITLCIVLQNIGR